ncbi:MAG: hypothetical protein KGS28_18255, partial [Betaproteobacteria bacterium]|nr:hypothetical protein [Betaproteobacteria bacterium]
MHGFVNLPMVDARFKGPRCRPRVDMRGCGILRIVSPAARPLRRTHPYQTKGDTMNKTWSWLRRAALCA